MALKFTYEDILKKVQSNKSLDYTGSPTEFSGEATLQIQQLEPIDFPMDDVTYESTFTSTKQDITKVLSITQDSVGFTNTFANAPQILLNSDRVIINSKRDYLMLFGAAGIAISSQNPVNIDSDSSITINATEGIYLGVPNAGKDYDFNNQKKPKTKGDPTENQAYEPVALGIKLANIIEDLLVVIKNARIVTPVGLAYFREDAQYDLANIQARLPEMLSSVVFVDGVSHEATDPAPKPPASITQPDTTITAQVNGTVAPAQDPATDVTGTTTTAPQTSAQASDNLTPSGQLGQLATQ